MSKTFLSIASGPGIAHGAGHYMTTSPGLPQRHGAHRAHDRRGHGRSSQP